jgi:uncharacterized membrane protein YdbT with pleckstrin-like domain
MNTEYQDIDLSGKNIHPSYLNYISSYFFALIFFAAAVVMYIKEITLWPIIATSIGIIVFLRVIFKRASLSYIVTRNSIRSKNGLIAKDESEIRVVDVREVGISQSIIQRLLGIGNVSFASAGTAGVEVTFEGISKPHKVKDFVNELRNSPEALDKKRCPQCGEFIWINAKICPHCQHKFNEK